MEIEPLNFVRALYACFRIQCTKPTFAYKIIRWRKWSSDLYLHSRNYFECKVGILFESQIFNLIGIDVDFFCFSVLFMLTNGFLFEKKKKKKAKAYVDLNLPFPSLYASGFLCVSHSLCILDTMWPFYWCS